MAKAEPSLQEVVERMKREIQEDVALGIVPPDVDSFSELHDHVDANEYGGFCEDEFGDVRTSTPDAFINFANEAQSAVDAWIKEGGLRG